MYDIVASIVTFRNNKDVLKKAIDSFLNTNLRIYLYVIDNSPSDHLKNICTRKNVEYIFANKNLGFGIGHNLSIRKMTGKTKYSVILNPDVYFNPGTLEELFSFMEKNEDVGLVMPKVLYPDGSLQYACRLLPDPWDMILRRINVKFLSASLRSKRERYELQLADHGQQMEVPYLSGCFMLARTHIFEKIGMFDEQFFLYFEDVDFSRRIHERYRTVYYPQSVIYHGYERGSCKNIKLLIHHIVSGIRYFNKWGWFFDRNRRMVNDKALRKVNMLSGEHGRV